MIKCPKCKEQFDMDEYKKNGRCSECGYILKDDPDIVNALLRQDVKKTGKYTKISSVDDQSKKTNESHETQKEKTVITKKKTVNTKVSSSKEKTILSVNIENDNDSKKVKPAITKKPIVAPRKVVTKVEPVKEYDDDEKIEVDTDETENHVNDTDITFEDSFEFEDEDEPEMEVSTEDSNDVINEETDLGDIKNFKETKEADENILLRSNKNKSDIETETIADDDSVSSFIKKKVKNKFKKEFPRAAKIAEFVGKEKEKQNKKNNEKTETQSTPKKPKDSRKKHSKITPILETDSDFSSNTDGYYNDVTFNNTPKADKIPFKSVFRIFAVLGILWIVTTFFIYYV